MSATEQSSWRLKSALAGISWPAVPDVRSTIVHTLFQQIESAQWLAPEQLAERQLEQLRQIVRHAAASVPWYRQQWAGVLAPGALTMSGFAALPVLRRRDLQAHPDLLRSEAVPQQHGEISESSSSGSTGTPVRCQKTTLNQLLWEAMTLRDHAWHGRDLALRLCVIRRGEAADADNWGSATAMYHTGPAHLCPVTLDVQSQLAWLARLNPGYLLTYPSLALELATLARREGVALPGLREVRTFGEPLDATVRQACADAWGVGVTDTYSSEEFGYLAIRCREGDNYHIQSENVLLEVLDDDGKACAPGDRGRVVVTSLLNFAMPLIRYELGDMAEVGPPCSCGRGLPVLARILGRSRNMLVTAGGKRYWPTFGFRGVHGARDASPVMQRQVFQTAFDQVRIDYVSSAALPADAEAALLAQLGARLPPGFGVSARRVDAIARSASGKFEEFISLVDRPDPA